MSYFFYFIEPILFLDKVFLVYFLCFIFYVEDEVALEVIQQKLNSAHNDSLMIVKNMYASAKQTENWQQLKTTQYVTTSIDLFFMGFLFDCYTLPIGKNSRIPIKFLAAVYRSPIGGL